MIERWRMLTWYGRWRAWIVKPLRRITGIEARWISRHPHDEE